MYNHWLSISRGRHDNDIVKNLHIVLSKSWQWQTLTIKIQGACDNDKTVTNEKKIAVTVTIDCQKLVTVATVTSHCQTTVISFVNLGHFVLAFSWCLYEQGSAWQWTKHCHCQSLSQSWQWLVIVFFWLSNFLIVIVLSLSSISKFLLSLSCHCQDFDMTVSKSLFMGVMKKKIYKKSF